MTHYFHAIGGMGYGVRFTTEASRRQRQSVERYSIRGDQAPLGIQPVINALESYVRPV